jgi:hypothetical protein
MLDEIFRNISQLPEHFGLLWTLLEGIMVPAVAAILPRKTSRSPPASATSVRRLRLHL